MAETLFYLLSAGAVAFGVGVVTARMPLFSVLSLLGSFFCISGIYLLAGFQFLAVTQLLVYAGAIMVLFLFVIMLLNLGDETELKRYSSAALSGRRLWIAVAAAGALALVGIVSVGWEREPVAVSEELTSHGIDQLTPLAIELFSRYMLPFEASSLLLLATMVSVVMLAKRQRGRAASAAEDSSEGTADDPLGWPWKKVDLQ